MGKFMVSFIATLRGDVELEVQASTADEAALMIEKNHELFSAEIIEELELNGDVEVDVWGVREASQSSFEGKGDSSCL